MPTILLKKSNTASAVPSTANLTNLAGGAEVAVNTADKRMFTMNSSSAVVELGTNPSSLTCADVSATLIKAASANITNLSAASATVTTGNLAFTGTAQRITGDFTNTPADRLAFQTNVVNSNTNVEIIPNGTATTAGIFVESDSAITNSSNAQLVIVGGGDMRVVSGIRGTGTYLPMSFYTGGSSRMVLDTSGNVGIGGTAGAANKLEISGTLPTSGAVTRSFTGTGTIPSGTTTAAINYSSAFTTAAASFTLTDMIHFNATQPTLGAGSAATNIYGFAAQSSLAVATNTYGFYGNIASGSNRYNVYMAGTADNYFAGNVGIGTASPGSLLHISSGTTTVQRIEATSTNGAYITYKNNGSDRMYCGTENSTGAGIIGTGAAYAGVVTTASTNPLVFGTNGAERMRIDSSGNVGIGTTTPDARLDVDAGATALAARVQGTNSPYFSVLDNDNNVEALVAADGAGFSVFGSISNHAVQFRTNNNEKMRLTSGGNLLVGTTTDVSGRSGVISDISGNVRAIPRTGSAKTSTYTLTVSDVGQFVELGTGGGIDVPNGVFSTGDVVSVFNNTTGARTVSLTITTAYIGGTDADKASVSLATRGVATVLFISNSVCVLTGNVS